MKITRIAQFEPADEMAREIWNFLLQRGIKRDEAIPLLNRLIDILNEHPAGLRPTIKKEFEVAASKQPKPCPRCKSTRTHSVEAHPDCDGGQDEMVLHCDDCGFENG